MMKGNDHLFMAGFTDGGARTQMLGVFLLSTAVLNVCQLSVIQERSPASFNSALKKSYSGILPPAGCSLWETMSFLCMDFL